MRVLHIAPGNLYGGVETLLTTLARYRDLCPSMEPEFAVSFEGRLSDELAAAGRSVHSLGPVKIRNPISIWRARLRLRELLEQQCFDVVVCHGSWPQAVFGPVVREAALPLAFWLHLATDGRHWLERWASRTRPDIAICPSQFVAATVHTIYVGIRGDVVYYPIAPHKNTVGADGRMKTRSEFGVPDETLVVIQASRMERWKGQALCLEALAMLRDLHGWECWQVGGPQRPTEYDYFEDLKKLSVSLGIEDRIRFFGQRSDVSRLLAASDVYCQPNTGLEGLPIIFGEALYAGLPIVSSALGGFWELVDQSCGILVPPNDPRALASALRSLVEDRDLLKRLSACAPNRAQQLFSLTAQLPKLSKSLAAVARAS
jgi:glycosyltransferase involved in cell wall biosynthesis